MKFLKTVISYHEPKAKDVVWLKPVEDNKFILMTMINGEWKETKIDSGGPYDPKGSADAVNAQLTKYIDEKETSLKEYTNGKEESLKSYIDGKEASLKQYVVQYVNEQLSSLQEV